MAGFGAEPQHKTTHKYFRRTHFFYRSITVTEIIKQTACVASDPTMSSKIQGLLFNADADNFFASHPDEEMNGEGIDKYVDVLADTGVSNLFIGVSDQRTNYDSKVWQSYWENFDPDGPDDQPRLRMALPDEVDLYRAELTRMVKFHQTGVDYPARMIQRARQRGITPWLTIRMNDAHGLESEFTPPNQ